MENSGTAGAERAATGHQPQLLPAALLEREAARSLQPAGRGLQRAAAREPRGSLRLDDQGHDEAQEAFVR